MSKSVEPTSSCCPYRLGSRQKDFTKSLQTIVRSKLDYGCIVYGSARPSYLKTLDKIHHQGIRLAVGGFRTSPADILLVQAKEPSLKNRREKLSLQFGIKLKSNRSNSTYDNVFRPNYYRLFQNKPNAIPTFGIRIAPALTDAGIKVRNIEANSVIDTPPWTLNKPEVIFSLTADKKDNTDAFILLRFRIWGLMMSLHREILVCIGILVEGRQLDYTK